MTANPWNSNGPGHDDEGYPIVSESGPGVWNYKTYNNVTNTLQSLELPAGVIELKATFYGVAASVGEAVGVSIGAVNATAGDVAITAELTPQVLDGTQDEWKFSASVAVTRVDFKTMIAETGTNKFRLEWKVAI